METKTRESCHVRAFCSMLVFMALVPVAQATVYRPGLVQARFVASDVTGQNQGTKYPSNLLATVSATNLDRTLDTMMANFHGDGNAYLTTPCTNPVSNARWFWSDYTTFAYEGEIRLQAGVAYNMFEQGDDGAAIVIDGTIILTADTTSRYQNGTGASFSPVATGWHRFNAYSWDWTGNKGPSAGCWGLAWNTNSTTKTSGTLTANTSPWKTFTDAGDLSSLRCATGESFVQLGSAIRVAETYMLPLTFSDLPMNATVTVLLDTADRGDDESAWAVSRTLGTSSANSGLQTFLFSDVGTATVAKLVVKGTEPTGVRSFADYLDAIVLADVPVSESAWGFVATTAVGYTNVVFSFATGLMPANATGTVSLVVSRNADYSDPVFSAAALLSVTETGTLTYTLQGLATNAYYYAKATVSDGGTTVESPLTFQTSAPGTPAVTASYKTTDMGETYAILNGTVSLGTGAKRATVYFDSSTATDSFTAGSYASAVLTGGDALTDVWTFSEVKVTIPAGQVVYGRVRVVNDWGLTACSETMAFVLGPMLTAERDVKFFSPVFTANLAMPGRGSARVERITLAVWDNAGLTGTPVFARDFNVEITNFPATIRALQAAGFAASTTYYAKLTARNEQNLENGSSVVSFTTPAAGDNVWANTSSDVEDPASYVYAWGKPATGKVLWFETPAVVSPVIDTDTTMPSLVFGVKDCGVSAALTNYHGGFVSCGYTITGRGTVTLSNQYPIDQLTFGTNTIQNPVCFGKGNGQTQTLRSQGGDLVLAGPISTPAGVVVTTLATEEFHYGTISLCGHSRDFNGKFKFSYTGGLSIRNPEALTNVSEFRIGYNWAGSATDWGQGKKPWLGAAISTKSMAICNQVGAPLVFSAPAFAQEANNEGVAFYGAPFVFSNATWTGEIRDSKTIDFSADFIVSNFVITSSSHLSKGGTGVLTILDDFRREPATATNMMDLVNGCFDPLTDAGWGMGQIIYVRNNNSFSTVGLHADHAPMLDGTGNKVLFTVNNAYSGFTAFGGDRRVCYKNDSSFNVAPLAGNSLCRFESGGLSSEGVAFTNYYALPGQFAFGNRSPSADGTVIFMNPMVYTNIHNAVTYFESTNHIVAVRLRGEIGLRASQWDQWYFDGNGFGGYAAVEAGNTAFSSRLIVQNKGNLLINGPLAARTVEVNDGCGVGGTNAIVGTLDSVKVAKGGALFGGEYGKGGSLTISGSLTMDDGAVLRSEIPPSGQAGVVSYANGTAGKKLTLSGKVYVELDIATNSPCRAKGIKVFDWSGATVGVDAGGWTVGTSENDTATFVPRLTGHVESMSLAIHDHALWASYKSDFVPKQFYIIICDNDCEVPCGRTANGSSPRSRCPWLTCGADARKLFLKREPEIIFQTPRRL